MTDTVAHEHAAHLVVPEQSETINVLGPTIHYLTPPAADDCSPCVMRGTIPPGVDIPLHSHADPETFIVEAGEVEGLVDAAGNTWVRIRPGAVFHVPGGARHAFRNVARDPAVMTVISTSRIGRFFQEVGAPVRPGSRPGPPSGEAIQHFLETSKRYGYWNASPEENARIGISLPAA